MSAVRPKTFGDDITFDPNSPPQIQYNTPYALPSTYRSAIPPQNIIVTPTSQNVTTQPSISRNVINQPPISRNFIVTPTSQNIMTPTPQNVMTPTPQNAITSQPISRNINIMEPAPRNIITTSVPQNVMTPQNIITTSMPQNVMTSTPRNIITTSTPQNVMTSTPRNIITTSVPQNVIVTPASQNVIGVANGCLIKEKCQTMNGIDCCDRVCKDNTTPWPSIIIGIVGAIIVIYTIIAPGVPGDRRIFGTIMMALWTAVWALILWVLWRECKKAATWWLLLIPVIIMAIFFILIIALNVGSPL